MASIIRTTFQLKRGKAETWQRLNPILAAGEPGYELDTGALKIGNGTTAWLDLPYLSMGEAGELLASLQKDIIDIQEQLDDTNSATLAGRLAKIESDYLTAKDKQSILDIVTSAKTEAVQEATNLILGGTVDAKFDTLQEIAKWIETDTTDSANLLIRLSEVEQKVADLENAGTASIINYLEYEISSRPEKSIIDYRDKEIRIFCAQDTAWVLQNSGEGSDPNRYYVGFKAYAPDNNVVGFKETLGEMITDNTLYSFENNPTAGIDKNGRKYSIVWLPVAQYDPENKTWTYFGDKSTAKKYVGWYYTVEWYDANGIMSHTDTIRINLTNKDCHNSIEPYYLSAINVNQLVQDEGEYLILNGGSLE